MGKSGALGFLVGADLGFGGDDGALVWFCASAGAKTINIDAAANLATAHFRMRPYKASFFIETVAPPQNAGYDPSSSR